MNEFEIIDNYGYKEYEYLEKVLNYTLDKLKITNSLFNVVFISNAEIKEINKQYRNIDSETDVISFAFNDNGMFPGPVNILGDIYISIDRMKSQALEYGHSEKRELSFLAVHGLLHLLGYDHTKGEKEEKEMFNLQKELLNQLGIID